MTSNRFNYESERNYKKQMSDLIDMSHMIEDENEQKRIDAYMAAITEAYIKIMIRGNLET